MCSAIGATIYDSRLLLQQQSPTLIKYLQDDDEGCTRCGRTNHKTKDCHAKFHISGQELEPIARHTDPSMPTSKADENTKLRRQLRDLKNEMKKLKKPAAEPSKSDEEKDDQPAEANVAAEADRALDRAERKAFKAAIKDAFLKRASAEIRPLKGTKKA